MCVAERGKVVGGGFGLGIEGTTREMKGRTASCTSELTGSLVVSARHDVSKPFHSRIARSSDSQQAHKVLNALEVHVIIHSALWRSPTDRGDFPTIGIHRRTRVPFFLPLVSGTVVIDIGS